MASADPIKGTRSAVDTASHFHRIAGEFDDLYESERRSALRRWLDSKLRASIYRRFELCFEELGELQGKSLLDVGCGGGRYSVMAAQLGAGRVVGADFAPNMIRLAEALARKEEIPPKRLAFVCGDAVETSFPEEPFDFAIAMGVFDYVEEPAAFLRKLLPKVRTRVVASFPVKWSPWTPQRLIRYRLFKRCPLYFYSRAKIRRVLRDAGVERYRILNAHRDYVVVMER
jgi:2-polyprenyl-3-methyl-5-hydroxy-6-metoxy-1,4-benzoquinol methylase